MQPTLADLEQLARRAGEILRGGYAHEHQVAYKGVIDLVTEVDHQSEAFLLGEIHRSFPGHRILSEEAGVIDGNDEDLWFIDPLDGTVNYAHGVPFFSVSIAYAQHARMTLGVVYDPMRDECFSAERGKGAWLNGQPIAVSSPEDLQHSLLVTGFAYDTWSTKQDNFDNFIRFSRRSQGVRRLGSAAIDLCYIACGRLDGYCELFLNPWDAAAGGLIAEEAGARITTVQGTPDYILPPVSVLAASPALHARMLAVLQGNDP